MLIISWEAAMKSPTENPNDMVSDCPFENLNDNVGQRKAVTVLTAHS